MTLRCYLHEDESVRWYEEGSAGTLRLAFVVYPRGFFRRSVGVWRCASWLDDLAAKGAAERLG